MAEFPDTYPEGLTPPPPGGVGTNVRGVVFIVIVLFTFVIATTVGGIRIYTRAFLAPTLGWDDRKCRHGWMRKRRKTDRNVVDTCVLAMVESLAARA